MFLFFTRMRNLDFFLALYLTITNLTSSFYFLCKEMQRTPTNHLKIEDRDGTEPASQPQQESALLIRIFFLAGLPGMQGS